MQKNSIGKTNACHENRGQYIHGYVLKDYDFMSRNIDVGGREEGIM